MDLIVNYVDADIFQIADVFSADECRELIARAESTGFQAATVRTAQGQKLLPNIRNNQRVNLHDNRLANQMFQRIQDVLPILDQQSAVYADPKLRFYKYIPGQAFKRHRDGSVTDQQSRVSKLSYLIFLNQEFEGGFTTFSDHTFQDGVKHTKEQTIVPATGSALLFRHRRWHEGTRVTQGVKYVLRTDIFYQSSPEV